MPSTRYVPVELVVTARLSFVASLAMATSAFATTAPLVSRTTPVRMPLLDWAFAVCIVNSSSHSITMRDAHQNLSGAPCVSPSKCLVFIRISFFGARRCDRKQHRQHAHSAACCLPITHSKLDPCD